MHHSYNHSHFYFGTLFFVLSFTEVAHPTILPATIRSTSLTTHNPPKKVHTGEWNGKRAITTYSRSSSSYGHEHCSFQLLFTFYFLYHVLITQNTHTPYVIWENNKHKEKQQNEWNQVKKGNKTLLTCLYSRCRVFSLTALFSLLFVA